MPCAFFWTKLDVGEMLRADLETESLVRWGNQRKCWGTFLILFILYLLLAFIFPVFLKVDLFSSIKHTSSSSPNIPWPRILFPSLLSCPCGRSMPCAAGPGAAGKEAEDAGGFGASPSLHGYSTRGAFLPPSFFIGHFPPGKLKVGKKTASTGKFLEMSILKPTSGAIGGSSSFKVFCIPSSYFHWFPSTAGSDAALRKRNRKTSSARWGSAPFEGMWGCAKLFKTIPGICSWPRKGGGVVTVSQSCIL